MNESVRGKRGKDVGDALGGTGVGLRSGSGGHGGKTVRVGEQLLERVEETAGDGQFLFCEEDGGAGIDHLLRVAFLVVVGGRGEWNEQGRFACGGKLGDGGRSAAGHDQAGLAEVGGHVGEKCADLPAVGIGAAGG